MDQDKLRALTRALNQGSELYFGAVLTTVSAVLRAHPERASELTDLLNTHGALATTEAGQRRLRTLKNLAKSHARAA